MALRNKQTSQPRKRCSLDANKIPVHCFKQINLHQRYKEPYKRGYVSTESLQIRRKILQSSWNKEIEGNS